MSRHIVMIPVAKALEALMLDKLPQNVGTYDGGVLVVHGYEYHLHYYFCTLQEDGRHGIHYGKNGINHEVDRWTYRDAMAKMGLKNAVEAVEADLPY